MIVYMIVYIIVYIIYYCILLYIYIGLWGYDSWIPTLQYITNNYINIPIIITSYTFEESEDDYETIMKYCNSNSNNDSTLYSSNNNSNDNDSDSSNSNNNPLHQRVVEWKYESIKNPIYSCNSNISVSNDDDIPSTVTNISTTEKESTSINSNIDYSNYISLTDIHDLKITTKRLVNNELIDYIPNLYYHCIYIRPVLKIL